MKTEMKVLLYLKKNEQDKDKLCPLMGKITIKGSRITSSQFACKIKIDANIWNATSQRCTGKSRKATTTNKEIESMLLLIRTRFEDLYSRGDNFTATDVKVAFQGIADGQATLLQFFIEHNEEYKLRIGINRAKATHTQYRVTLLHLTNFVKSHYKVSDIALKMLDESFIENFCNYLKIEKLQKVNTLIGHINRLKSVTHIAIYKGLIDRNPFKDFPTPKQIKKQRYLSQEDLSKLMTTKLDTPNRNFTRDMFLFSTFTGISHCDMVTLSENNLKRDDMGRLWIMTTRQKSKVPENVLLLDVAIKILEKYRGTAKNGLLFPMLTKESMNLHLKKIAQLCGINQPISYHQSRHCFATQICLSQGVPIEAVSRAMGHKNISTTQRYAKITHEKIDKDVDIFSSRIAGKFALNGIDAPPSTILKDMSRRKTRPSKLPQLIKE